MKKMILLAAGIVLSAVVHLDDAASARKNPDGGREFEALLLARKIFKVQNLDVEWLVHEETDPFTDEKTIKVQLSETGSHEYFLKHGDLKTHQNKTYIVAGCNKGSIDFFIFWRNAQSAGEVARRYLDDRASVLTRFGKDKPVYRTWKNYLLSENGRIYANPRHMRPGVSYKQFTGVFRGGVEFFSKLAQHRVLALKYRYLVVRFDLVNAKPVVEKVLKICVKPKKKS